MWGDDPAIMAPLASLCPMASSVAPVPADDTGGIDSPIISSFGLHFEFNKLISRVIVAD